MSGKAILLFFTLCAVADFVWGYVHERSVPAGVISVVGGLFGTAFYFLVFSWAWRAKAGTALRVTNRVCGFNVEFAARHTFLIDPEGKIRKAYTDVSPSKHSAEVLAELGEMQR
jgi:hypothetical protein